MYGRVTLHLVTPIMNKVLKISPNKFPNLQ
jgi:hypothetical protein